MAIVIQPAMSMQATGSVGDVTFIANGQRTSARLRVSPTQPDTAAQLTARARMASAVANYQILTHDQLMMWRAYVKGLRRKNRLGQVYTPNAYQAYIEYNLNLQQVGLSQIYEPPQDPVPYLFKAMSLTSQVVPFEKMRLAIPYYPVGLAGSKRAIYKAGPYLSPGRMPQNSEFKYRTAVTTIAYYDDYSVDAGSYYYYRVRLIDSFGRSSPIIEAGKIID